MNSEEFREKLKDEFSKENIIDYFIESLMNDDYNVILEDMREMYK